MKTFKVFFSDRLNELQVVKPKAKGEQGFVKSTYLAQVKDPGDLEKVGPEEVGPKDTKSGQGKRPLDRLDNKQPFGEESHQSKTTMKHINKPTSGEKKAAKDIKPGVAGYRDRVAMLKSAQARGALKKEETEPEAAKKAYATIKAKMKEEKEQNALIALYDSLNEENQKVFLEKFETDADKILEFALSVEE